MPGVIQVLFTLGALRLHSTYLHDGCILLQAVLLHELRRGQHT